MQIIDALLGGNIVVTIIVIAILICLFIFIKGKVRYIIGTAAAFYIIGILFNQQGQIVQLITGLKGFVSYMLHIS